METRPDGEAQPACPICGQADVVRKVSQAYAEGYVPLPKRSPLSLGPARRVRVPPAWLGGTPQMRLSARLAPPEQPQHPGVFASSDGQGLNTQALLLVTLRYLLLAGTLALLLVSLLPASSARAWAGWMTLALLLAILLLRRVLLDRVKVQQASLAMPRWEEDMRLWQRLYYCARDDRVFDAGSSRTAAVEEWKSLGG